MLWTMIRLYDNRVATFSHCSLLGDNFILVLDFPLAQLKS